MDKCDMRHEGQCVGPVLFIKPLKFRVGVLHRPEEIQIMVMETRDQLNSTPQSMRFLMPNLYDAYWLFRSVMCYTSRSQLLMN